MVDFTPNNIVKYGYMWVVVMMVIQLITAGYDYSSGYNINSENSLAGIMMKDNIAYGGISSLNNDTSNKIGTNGEGLQNDQTLIGTILDQLDKLIPFMAFFFIMVQFLPLANVFQSLRLVSLVSTNISPVLGIAVFMFMALANIIYALLVWKFMVNKGRFD